MINVRDVLRTCGKGEVKGRLTRMGVDWKVGSNARSAQWKRV